MSVWMKLLFITLTKINMAAFVIMFGMMAAHWTYKPIPAIGFSTSFFISVMLVMLAGILEHKTEITD